MKKWSVKRKVLVSLLGVLLTAGILLYVNFNRLVSEAVMMSFNSSIISDVYELKFEKLRVNVLEGDIRVVNVVVQPREKPLREYPYINSSLRLEAERITLIDVQLWTLVKSGGLSLREISIMKPSIRLDMSEQYPNLFPFSDTVATKEGETKKKALSVSLTHFRLEDAVIHVTNEYRKADSDVGRFNLTLDDFVIDQRPDTNFITLRKIDLSITDFRRSNKTGPFIHSSFSKFHIGMDSFRVRSTMDTLTFRMSEFTTGIADLDLHTRDSLFHVTLGSFGSSYKNRHINLTDLSFEPNISKEAMQARFEHQNVQVSGKLARVDIKNINFDSLIYFRSLFIDSVVIDEPKLTVFKDKTKSIDSTRTPPYLGQQIAAIKLPLRIRHVAVNNISMVNEERKPDSTSAKVALERGSVRITNITNLSKAAPLVLNAKAALLGKINFSLQLDFSYSRPQFDFLGTMGPFALPELNPALQAYTPASITRGSGEDMKFSGKAEWTKASGTMTFLYQDLEVDLALKDQQKWKSALVAFAANTIVNTSNPGGKGLPPRVVTFHIERDMHKGFVNIVLRSLLTGVKESLVMSKENRAAYNEARKKQRKKDS